METCEGLFRGARVRVSSENIGSNVAYAAPASLSISAGSGVAVTPSAKG